MIAIKGQYVFRDKGSAPVGIIYPDTTRGKVFAAAPGESFSHQELIEISEIVRSTTFSRYSQRRRKTRLSLRNTNA